MIGRQAAPRHPLILFILSCDGPHRYSFTIVTSHYRTDTFRIQQESILAIWWRN
jgi:hypothetical protein